MKKIFEGLKYLVGEILSVAVPMVLLIGIPLVLLETYHHYVTSPFLKKQKRLHQLVEEKTKKCTALRIAPKEKVFPQKVFFDGVNDRHPFTKDAEEAKSVVLTYTSKQRSGKYSNGGPAYKTLIDTCIVDLSTWEGRRELIVGRPPGNINVRPGSAAGADGSEAARYRMHKWIREQVGLRYY